MYLIYLEPAKPALRFSIRGNLDSLSHVPYRTNIFAFCKDMTENLVFYVM